MMDNTAFDAKPSNNSLAGTRPIKPMATMTRMAAMSTRTNSETNRPIVAESTTSTSIMSALSVRPDSMPLPIPLNLLYQAETILTPA
jgi:hypothetical protein